MTHRRMFVITACLLSGMLSESSVAQIVHAKREFRGAWIATVTNLDFPSSRFLSTASQKAELTSLLDALRETGINAVIFQVRPECDALYASPYEPWSYWLTDQQGLAPNPFYDPLEFVVEEAHKRGMEIHAWFNPYRAYRQNDTYPLAANSVITQHPEWIITCPDGYKLLDPGKQVVRDFVATVITDVTRRYNVDGVHMDDYFYPYSEHNFTNQDAATFSAESRGIANLADWRRDNVNLLVKQVYDSVQSLKPWVKVGMSPFGIWKSGVPQGIFGMSAYDAIYCDAIAWLQQGSIDYLTPQLYWPFGGGQDYGLLQQWWSDSTSANGRHLYPGQGTYRVLSSGWSPSEISDQIIANRENPNVQGSVHFRAKNILLNDGGVTDELKSGVYTFASAIPVMPWKETVPPIAPSNMAETAEPSTGIHTLTWNAPTSAADGDTAARYVVYRFNAGTVNPGDEDNPRHLLGLSGIPTYVPKARLDSPGVKYAFAVSALDKNNNESAISNVVQFDAPISAPTLIAPADSELYFAKTSVLRWNKPESSLLHRVQVSLNTTFSPDSLLLDRSRSDTSTTLGGMTAETWYYWRVMAGNQGESSQFSEVRRFRTGWPKPPTIVYPITANNTAHQITLIWNEADATSYRVRLIDDSNQQVVVNTVVTDTTYFVEGPLASYRIYKWNVQSINPYGESEWSTEGRFRTKTGTAVREEDDGIPSIFQLAQNYPNPFNSETTIRFSLPTAGWTTLRVYDLLGREVATLVSDDLSEGSYTSRFEANRLPTGTYIYVLDSSGKRLSAKLLLLK